MENKKRHAKRLDIDERIDDILKEMRIPKNVCNYEYLKLAIKLIYKQPNLGKNLKNELYPIIAKELNSTPKLVGEKIRGIIRVILRIGDEDALLKYCKIDKKNQRKIKTVQFLYSISECLNASN